MILFSRAPGGAARLLRVSVVVLLTWSKKSQLQNPSESLTSRKVVEALSFCCADNFSKGGYVAGISTVVSME
ncbi:MAG: hypothetical protein ABSF90_17350 [Syntrophobacteraceae bacterium]|jgi:hypothetical protein